ncbi:MAG TPA: hypothetical protein VFF03_13540 [Rhodocyclaceae bacterium]|nr:hypothetical protein [Rhodocyclaceae bacterium]
MNQEPQGERYLGQITLSPARLSWLTALAKTGQWTKWDNMPRRNGSMNPRVASITNRTWTPMVDAGLIERRYHMGHNEFRITDTGRAALNESGK